MGLAAGRGGWGKAKEGRLKIVYLEWIDSVSSGGWQSQDGVPDMTVKSVGLLVAEDKKTITISTSIYGKVSESPLTIPKCALIKRRVVKGPK